MSYVSDVEVAKRDDGTYCAQWPFRKYRVLFNDGTVIDLVATHDSSDMRGALLTAANKDGIEGIVDLGRVDGLDKVQEGRCPAKKKGGGQCVLPPHEGTRQAHRYE